MTPDPDWELNLPPEWKTADWLVVEPMATLDLSTGGQALLVSALLKDGSNVFGVVYPGGQRFARTAIYTNWAIEERYAGDPPAAGSAEKIDKLWRALLDLMAKASAATEDELGGRPSL